MYLCIFCYIYSYVYLCIYLFACSAWEAAAGDACATPRSALPFSAALGVQFAQMFAHNAGKHLRG
jgi:hypothetical protein